MYEADAPAISEPEVTPKAVGILSPTGDGEKQTPQWFGPQKPQLFESGEARGVR